MTEAGRRKARIKLALASILALSGVALAVAGIGVSGWLLVTAERSSSAGTIENRIPERLDGLPSWSTAPDATILREVDAVLLERIADGYIRAWDALAGALGACDPGPLDETFAGGALAQTERAVEAAAGVACVTGRVATPGVLELRFVSADGAIVAFVDRGLRITDTVPGPDQRPRTLATTGDRRVVMVLDDGTWRVHAWLQVATAPLVDGQASVP